MSTILKIKMTKKILLLSIVITGTFSWQILKLLKLGGGGGDCQPTVIHDT